MSTRFFIVVFFIMISIYMLAGCLSSVDGTPSGDGLYDFDLAVGDLSLDKFPASAYSGSGGPSYYDMREIDTSGDTDYCEMLCDCADAMGVMDYDDCLDTIDYLTEAECEEQYLEVCGE